MNTELAGRQCPHCGSNNAPILVVRGSGLRGVGITWKCRSCESEWSDARWSHRAS